MHAFGKFDKENVLPRKKEYGSNARRKKTAARISLSKKLRFFTNCVPISNGKEG